MKIENVSYKLVESRLKKSYNLSYQSLDSYHSVVVMIELADGTLLHGEATPLRGYTDETVESVVSSVKLFKRLILDKDVKEAIALLGKEISVENSFALSALLPPLELYETQSSLDQVSVKDLLFSVDITNVSRDDLQSTLSVVAKEGHTTIKVKLGRDYERELEALEMLSELDLKGLRIRFDANCGYDYAQTRAVLEVLSSILAENTEYLEQPLPRKAWVDMERIIKSDFQVPIMIDESIYSLQDIGRAADIGAKFIKLKLAKFGSLSKLKEALTYACDRGLQVVFGNGVATDISNHQELIFYYDNKHLIHGATESVGFLKLKEPLQYHITVKA